MLISNIFTDSLVNPQHLDYADQNWAYPIPDRDLSGVPIGEGNGIVDNVYRSTLIPVRSLLDQFSLKYLDLIVYCHGAAGSNTGSVRVLCWKDTWETFTGTAGIDQVRTKVVNNTGLVDVLASTRVGASSGVYFLRIADSFDNLQLLVAANCTGVSAYLQDPGSNYAKFPNTFIRTVGAS